MEFDTISRRRLLRGTIAGAAVSVGIPFLDCFLNQNGTALAATGQELPVCFGTWFWGLSLPPGHWEPTTVGAGYELRPMMKALEPFRDQISIISGLQVHLDGRATAPHFSGPYAIFTGTAPETVPSYGKSFDTSISDAIGLKTRFRSLEVTCDNNPTSTWSSRGLNNPNPAEPSPAKLYSRIFGPDFKDPNSAEFKPDPYIMMKHSVLSAVSEQRKELLSLVGAADRRRLDQYFTSLRELERKMEIELERPAPMAACSIPGEKSISGDPTLIATAKIVHDAFADLLAHALACGQTRVFNLSITEGMSGLRRPGDSTHHHLYSHEEAIDAKLGYQPVTTWFSVQYMDFLHNMLTSLHNVQEGDGTLLDRVLMFVASDHGEARKHTMTNIPIMFAGKAGGRIKTGIHVSAPGSPATRAGLTAQQVMGLSVGEWGTLSNTVSNPITEIMA